MPCPARCGSTMKLALAKQFGVFDKHGDHPATPREGFRDLAVHPVAPPAVPRIPVGRPPTGTDHHQQDRAGLQRAEDRLDEVVAWLDGPEVPEHRIRPESLAQGTVEQRSVTGLFPNPVVDKDFRQAPHRNHPEQSREPPQP